MKQNTKLLKTAIERRGKSKCLLVRLRPKGRLNVAHWYEEPNGTIVSWRKSPSHQLPQTGVSNSE